MSADPAKAQQFKATFEEKFFTDLRCQDRVRVLKKRIGAIIIFPPQIL